MRPVCGDGGWGCLFGGYLKTKTRRFDVVPQPLGTICKTQKALVVIVTPTKGLDQQMNNE